MDSITNLKSLLVLRQIARLARFIGLGTLLTANRNLLDLVFEKLDWPPLKVRIDDFEICGYLRHRSFLEQISAGSYESFSIQLFRKALRPGTFIVDAGAHIGLYSLLGAPRVGNSQKIFSYEPDPYNFKALVFNISKNHYNNIIPIQKALSNSIGLTSFYKSLGTIGSSLVKRRDVGKMIKIPVPSTTLDTELQGFDISSIVIKLDVEGAELLALDGMSNILDGTDSAILIVELNPSALLDAGVNSNILINDLRKHGFRKIHFVDELNKKLIPVTNLTIPKKGNLYCIKDR
jgi:FkbM family methyltransferase